MKRIKLCVPDLSTDLLREIFDRLSLVELVRAGAVSRTWYEVSRSCLPFVMKKPRTPWLMWWNEGYFKQDEICCYAKNFEENGRSYTIEGSWEDLDFYDFHPQFAGCSSGWLVMLDTLTANPYLLNPFTKTQINLAPIEQFDPSFIERVEDGHPRIPCELFVYHENTSLWRFSPNWAAWYLQPQAIVTVDEGNKVSGVFMRLCWRISYWRRRDGRCFSMKREQGSPEPWYMMLEDNKKLYVLNESWNVEIWDFCDGRFERLREIISAGPYPAYPIADHSKIEMNYMIKYLVKIGTGEVLIAVRFIELRNEEPFMKHWFELYKMNAGVVGKEESVKWERVQELEGYGVFFGHNEPMALLAEQVKGCRGNAIYYTHDHESSQAFYQGFNVEDMGILDLHTKGVEYLFKLPSVNAAVWIVPNLSE